MKKNLRSLLYTCLCGLLLTFLVSFVFSILYFFNLFIGYLGILSKFAGYLIFIICAFLLGKNIKEKTFFYAFGFACVGILISLFFIEKSLISFLLLGMKWFLFIVIALIARNM